MERKRHVINPPKNSDKYLKPNGNLKLSCKFLTIIMIMSSVNNYGYSYVNLICGIAAAQMWNLATYPLIGDKVPQRDKYWECYLLLLEIMKVCTAKTTSEPSAYYLSALIADHHHMFKSCYPDVNLTPKFHYMVHFPRLLLT